VIVYLPGASCGNSYVPFWSVLRVMWEPVAALSRPTSAPASNAPEGSATVPRSEVSPVCDQRSAALPKNNAQNSSHLQQFISVSRTPEMERWLTLRKRTSRSRRNFDDRLRTLLEFCKPRDNRSQASRKKLSKSRAIFDIGNQRVSSALALRSGGDLALLLCSLQLFLHGTIGLVDGRVGVGAGGGIGIRNRDSSKLLPADHAGA